MRLSRKEFLSVVTSAGAGTAVASAVTVGDVAAQGAATPKPKKLEGAAIKGATEAVKRFITTTSLAAIPVDAVQQAKRCLIDGFGVILAGSTVRGSAIVAIQGHVGQEGVDRVRSDKLMAPAARRAGKRASGHAMD
jgi:2-methylcitrate dehydratase PrpD